MTCAPASGYGRGMAYQYKVVELRGTARGGIPVGGDGEPLGTLPMVDAAPATVEVVPGALAVIA